ncbi:hypothetical protein BXY85_1336 [Roseivirga pacifica]|uniref:Uncharacterized protein n=1 Tax=Roseivirga pacifica TaxID=1267423 RepID=A0A1I0MF91_9BACT|nr:hypothetical protein [Roseivirga pacifica]RKQ50322.1 hypothetical protein BXY85_1336 [Roseivirga pacifica]SEV86594.1 hypothetical protein SAMN05216290_0320 [Roseivirga pacifica]
MKYKNINAFAHNFCHSFLSLMNYVDGDYVIDELTKVRRGHIEIDFLQKTIIPVFLEKGRVKRSMGFYERFLKESATKENIDLSHIKTLKLIWEVNERLPKYLVIDDRDKVYSKNVVTHGR